MVVRVDVEADVDGFGVPGVECDLVDEFVDVLVDCTVLCGAAVDVVVVVVVAVDDGSLADVEVVEEGVDEVEEEEEVDNFELMVVFVVEFEGFKVEELGGALLVARSVADEWRISLLGLFNPPSTPIVFGLSGKDSLSLSL